LIIIFIGFWGEIDLPKTQGFVPDIYVLCFFPALAHLDHIYYI